jgi:ATP-dependent RNA circularization protein (DNA/RNA ligase family)
VGTISTQGTQIGIIRIYRLPAVANVFRPAAMVEERITGHRVRVKSVDE